MIKIAVYSVSDRQTALISDLRSLGCTLIVVTGQRNKRGQYTERFNIEVYVNEEDYLQVLDLLLSISSQLVIKDVPDDYNESESHYFVILEKLRKHYGR